MKKALMYMFTMGLSVSASASVCVLQTQGSNQAFSDAVYSMTCDGKTVSESGATLTLQKYLSNGYKIAGQSSTQASVIYTLVK